MAEKFVLSFVEKLILLEKKAGAGIPYRNLPPISTPLDDIVSIQSGARHIAESIGLSRFVFIVTFAKQKKNVGGHIDLGTNGDAVYIEIDPDAISEERSAGIRLSPRLRDEEIAALGVHARTQF